MTSAERRNARYIRRKEKRDKQRQQTLEFHGSLENITDLNALIVAAKDASRGIMWKTSVQRYKMSLLRNVTDLYKKLMRGEDIRRGFVKFLINDRGKTRNINNVHFSERVAHRALCANALAPVLTKSLIYDCAASIKGKGLSFASNRLKAHLRRHYRKHGNEGYVLQLDFSNYFAHLRHEVIEKILRHNFNDERLISLTMSFVSSFGPIGLGLGCEVSQILATIYPSRVDHYIKEKLKIKGYARYMDDSYLIHEDKEYLKECLEDLKQKFMEIGIVLNTKKTRLIKLSKGFTFLKTQYFLTNTGKVICKASREAVVRQRRKLKKFKKFADAREMSFEQICGSYLSWRGCMQRKDAYRSIQSMDVLFNELFKE